MGSRDVQVEAQHLRFLLHCKAMGEHLKVLRFQELGSDPPLSSTGGLSQLCLKFATLKNQLHSFFIIVMTSLTPFIKGKYIKAFILA